MPSYVNPSTMMGGQLSPKSALHGALAGIQGAYATKMADQQIRDTDQDFMANMQKYQQAVADEPLNEAKRGASIAEADYLREMIESGAKRSAFDAELEGKVLGNKGKQLEIDEKEIEQRGDFLVRVAGLVDKFNDQDPATVGEWGQIVDEGKKNGVNLPSWPSPQHKEMIKSRAATYVNSVKHQQKQAEIKTTADNELRVRADPRLASSVKGQLQIHEADNEARKITQAGKDEASMENARIRAGAQQRYGDLDKVLAPLLISKIKSEAATGGLSEETLKQAAGYADSRAEAELASHPTYPLLKMAGMSDPEKAAIALDIKKAKVSAILDSLGINGAGQAAAGKVVNSPSNPAAKPGGGPISSKAEYDALPKGAAFTWNGKAGIKP